MQPFLCKIMIKIQDSAYFNPKSIFECGQMFRYMPTCNGAYRIVSAAHMAIVEPKGNGYEIQSTNDNYFTHYFDLQRDYTDICEKLAFNEQMVKALEFGRGIRILAQNKFETLISFIISSNNHIPRIKGIIERLSTALGERKHFYGFDYFAFPTAEALASKSEDYFISQGLGYRARYILETAKKISQGFDLEELTALSTRDARKELCSLMGVGSKVADCILLFAYGKYDVFPVDTWMEKVYYDYFDKNKLSAKQISDYFVNIFGCLSGFAQQYLFYYKREQEI